MFAVLCCGGQFGRDLPDQPVVLGQPEQIVDTVGFAPCHQRLAGKAGIGPQQDAHLRPACTDVPGNPFDFFDRSRTGVDVGAAQLGRQQMPAAEDIERQIAVAVIVAVEEAPFLVAMDRIIRGVQIEDDPVGSGCMRFHEQIDKQRFDRRRIVADLVIARRLGLRQFQPVQRRLAGHRRAIRPPRPQLPSHDRKQRVMPQMVMIVEVFIAQRHAVEPLPDQRRHRVLDQIGPTTIAKAARKAIDKPHNTVRLSQQQRARIRRDRAAIKTGHNFVALHPRKIKLLCATLCRHRGVPETEAKLLLHNNFL